jgi:hypothetical protein
MNVKLVLTYLGILFVFVATFGGGFYFGFKYQTAQAAGYTSSPGSPSSIAGAREEVQITAKEVEGVHWIKVGDKPECPDLYPVKGTFSDNLGYFYTKDNKSYDRVKPDICFATEEFAKNSAGFVKKF